MAQRRMFSLQIVDSDAFLDMPSSSQLLYFHLSMRADDDGFVDNPKKVMRMIGAQDDDFKVLMTKRFVLSFKSGIIVIKHWKIHNYIQNDRYHETKYLDEKNGLIVKDNGSYTERIQNVSRMDTEARLGKASLEQGKVKEDATKSGVVEELLNEKGGIQHDYQYVGLELFDKLDAPKNKKGECIRLAKLYPHLIDPSLAFCLDYPNPALKWKMFLWKLNALIKGKNEKNTPEEKNPKSN